MINRKPLRSQIIEVVWQLIVEGKLQPNEPLREVHLSKLLNISRTPLREALQRLEWEGIVTSAPGKGFRLATLSEEEVREIYPLRAKLESYALELSGIPSSDVLEELTSINKKMLKTNSPKELVVLDERWHDLLLSNCTNRKLLEMIKVLHRQSQRYEYAYMNMDDKSKVSVEQHEQIIKYLQKGELLLASKLLAANNVVGVEALIESLKK